ncbi:DUF4115 domain-containing protein [Massilia sp. G4R7]|uniref:DUF4115 domain-containing protein n=1 Tax=Massilia phyllostachyos TaxID=2898585 RepID=A0ABS8Q2N8_9BURK|nr:helix-turn-helix domain-containing protein [Massilia phyllostachyos]MCD2516013.1 DUF4115 domain-containing protein [Massilia phyllostachyos]
MNEHADQPATPGKDTGIPGKTLQSQREAMGWSVEQVADQLKLAPRQILALEAGNYAALPSPAVTRGFVRAYAKLLKIDAAPLVAMIEMNMPPEAQAGASNVRREQRPASFSEKSRFPVGGKRNKVPAGLIGGVIVLAAAGAALWHFGLLPGSNQPAPHSNPDGAVIETPMATPGGIAPAGQDALQSPSVPLISVPAPAAEGAAPGAAPATTPAAPATAPATVPGATATPAAPAATAPAPVAAAPVAAPAAAGGNALVLNVREDSWIGVRPVGGGKPLLWREVKAGATETIDLAGPVTLTVGNPGGVTATLRGAAVGLQETPGKKFAQVSLK